MALNHDARQPLTAVPCSRMLPEPSCATVADVLFSNIDETQEGRVAQTPGEMFWNPD